MRRTKLAAVIAGTAMAIALPVLAVAAPGGSTPTDTVSASGNIDNCKYPSNKPTLSLSGPKSVKRNQNIALKGQLLRNTCAEAGQPITLYRSTDNTTFTAAGSTTTDAKGGYSFSRTEPLSGTYYYYALFPGDSNSAPAQSNTVTVVVK